MIFEAKSAKSTVTPLLTLGGQTVKYVNHYKYLGVVLDNELSDDKDIQRHLQCQYCAANKLRASFSRCSSPVKIVLFYGVISESHTCKDCGWLTIFDGELYMQPALESEC